MEAMIKEKAWRLAILHERIEEGANVAQRKIVQGGTSRTHTSTPAPPAWSCSLFHDLFLIDASRRSNLGDLSLDTAIMFSTKCASITILSRAFGS